jgi:molybdopterin synthase sulfur carrier subunit
MPVLVRIPTPLRTLARGNAEARTDGDTLSAVIEDLERQFPGIKERILDEAGELRRFVNVYVNQEDVRFLQGLKTALKETDEVSIVPAIAGGC